MKISKNTVVLLSYELTLDNGEIVDSASKEEPFSFLFGGELVLPKFEEELLNKTANTDFGFSIEAESAYGDYNEEYVKPLDPKLFADAEDGVVVIGNSIPLQDEQGNTFHGVIKEITPESVFVDFNHPLAGENLNFKGKVLNVRTATEQELETKEVSEA